MPVRNNPSHSLSTFPSFSLVGNNEDNAANITASSVHFICQLHFPCLWFWLNYKLSGQDLFFNIAVCSKT